MLNAQTDIKINFLRRSIADFFDIDDSFVDISAVRSTEKNKPKYRCRIKQEITENNLKKFHLSVYTFLIDAIDINGFCYEGNRYSFDEINIFLEKLVRQMKELN